MSGLSSRSASVLGALDDPVSSVTESKESAGQAGCGRTRNRICPLRTESCLSGQHFLIPG